MFDFHCDSCGHEFEELVKPDVYVNKVCPNCSSGKPRRLVSAGHIDYRRMGVDLDFPTAGEKWTKMQEQRKRIENKRGVSYQF